MSALIPFESAGLPAYMTEAPDRIAELAAGGIGFPVLSYKGKVWSIKRSGEKTTIMRPDDDETPAATLDVVILRAGQGVSKVFYSTRYTDGNDDAPACFSNDGIRPDPSAEEKQSDTCATCPHNVFGTAVGEDGSGKGKRCGDFKRLAVAAASSLEDPLLLRIPPASLRNLTEYSKMLATRNVRDYAVVVTRLSFDHDAATPKVKFKPIGFLAEAQYKVSKGMYDDPVVQEIVGLLNKPVAQPAPAEPIDDDVDEPAPAPAPAKKAAPKKPATPVAPPEDDEEEEDETPPPPPKPAAKRTTAAKKTNTSMFAAQEVADEEEEEAPPPKAAAPAKKPAVTVPQGLEAELDSLLEGFDD